MNSRFSTHEDEWSKLPTAHRISTSVPTGGFKQTLSPANGSGLKDPAERMFVKQQSYSEGKLQPDVPVGTLMNLPPVPVYRSCVHYEVPLRFISSVVCLHKLLSISLLDPAGKSKEKDNTALYKSTVSLHLGISSSYQRTYNIKKDVVQRAQQAATVATHQGQTFGFCSRPVSKPGDWTTQDHEPTSGLLSFKEQGSWNTKEYKQQGNADEPTFTSQSNFRHRPHTLSVGPDVSRSASKKTDCRKGQSCPHLFKENSVLDDAHDYPLQRREESLDTMSTTLSLKEALELLRPDFISRSQGRVRRLELRARRRRALQTSNPDLVKGLGGHQGREKRNCTLPDPLSDNLFKPRERSISGREMQLRSRRIYNKLPEVMRKREEVKKRTVTQTNRLRAEVFKKRLLDQVLQR